MAPSTKPTKPTTTTSSGVDFEYLIEKAGPFGIWQIRLFLFLALNGFFMAFQHLGSVFLAATPDHWCKLSSRTTEYLKSALKLTAQQIKHISIPKNTDDNGLERYSKCQYYDRNYTQLTLGSDLSNVNVADLNNSPISVQECYSWEYDTSQYSSTIVTEWDLVCKSKWLMSTVQGSYMAGVLVGCLIFGFISDRWGRRKAMLIAQLLFSSMSITTSFAHHYSLFIIGRFLIAVSTPGVFGCCFVLITEIVPTRWRSYIGIYYQIPFGLGYAVLPALGYFLRDWNVLQLAMSLPTLTLLASFWIVPESPRWLIVNNKYEEALTVLHRCAKANGRLLPPDEDLLNIMKELQQKEEEMKKLKEKLSKKILITQLCSTKEMFKRTVTAYITWFVVAMVYYGLALNSPELGENPYLVVFMGGILEVPAYFLGSFLVSRAGRRITYCVTFVMAGVVCFSILFSPAHITWLTASLAILGKFIITITFAISYLYTAELFPTVIRNIAVSYGSMCARLGSIIAPYIVYLLGGTDQKIPLIVFGCASTVAGIVALLLPETRNSHLHETVTDVRHAAPSRRRSKDVTENGGEPLQLQPLADADGDV